jgi:hypothetical protein
MNMKKLILINLISISLIFVLNGQIYTPSGVIQGSSGNNNVGIGITPNFKLDVNGEIAIGSGSVNANTTKMFIRNSSGKTWAVSSGANMNNQTNFSIYNWTDHGSESTPLPYLNITQEGNVGIGLHTPGNKLDVNGEIAIGSGSVNANTTKMFIRNSLGKTWAISSGANMITESSFSIYNWSDNQSTPFFHISENGNVGIGVNNPGTKLDVGGTIRAHEVKVCLNQGCDFVFKTDYRLMDLNELEMFVKTNQHLPEIAPEKDMVENGVNMKEMQMKLLQKIEELTLYTIEQNKKITELEKQNERLKAIEEKIAKLELTAEQ